VLRYLAETYGGVAFWAHIDQTRIFCFDRVDGDNAFDPGFGRGQFPQIANTSIPIGLAGRAGGFVEERQGDFRTILLPVLGRGGHVLGFIGLSLTGKAPRVRPAQLELEVRAAMSQ
jgi:hypothetical protein